MRFLVTLCLLCVACLPVQAVAANGTAATSSLPSASTGKLDKLGKIRFVNITDILTDQRVKARFGTRLGRVDKKQEQKIKDNVERLKVLKKRLNDPELSDSLRWKLQSQLQRETLQYNRMVQDAALDAAREEDQYAKVVLDRIDLVFEQIYGRKNTKLLLTEGHIVWVSDDVDITPEILDAVLRFNAENQDGGPLKYAVTVTTIHKNRSNDSKVVGKLNPGQPVKAGIFKDGWYAVYPDYYPLDQDTEEADAQGYVYAPMLQSFLSAKAPQKKIISLKPKEESTEPAAVETVQRDSTPKAAPSNEFTILTKADPSVIYMPKRFLNMRDGRNRFTKVVKVVSKKQRFRLGFCDDNGWCAVFAPDDSAQDESTALGYVNSKYVKPADNESE